MFTRILSEQTAQMGLTITESQARQMTAYQERLIEINRVMNLTRVPDDPAEAVARNYLDSLSILTIPEIRLGKNLLDVGSGAGFPGIPLAIMRPDIRVTLLDSSGKRVAFLQEIIDMLGLHARAVHARSEDAARDIRMREAFDAVTARAVAETRVLMEWILPFAKVGGVCVAYKGPKGEEELTDAKNAIRTLGGRIAGVYDARIPGHEDWSHKLIAIQKIKPTPGAYPRRAGEAGKNPL